MGMAAHRTEPHPADIWMFPPLSSGSSKRKGVRGHMALRFLKTTVELIIDHYGEGRERTGQCSGVVKGKEGV